MPHFTFKLIFQHKEKRWSQHFSPRFYKKTIRLVQKNERITHKKREQTEEDSQKIQNIHR